MTKNMTKLKELDAFAEAANRKKEAETIQEESQDEDSEQKDEQQ